jgi:hypothetical protein
MSIIRPERAGLVVALAAATMLLTGCTPPAPIPSATVAAPTVSATPTPSPTASATAAGTSTPPHTTDDPCLRDSISTTYTPTDNTAGHAHGIITITNISSKTCNIQGYPTVFFDNPEAQQAMGAESKKDTSGGMVADFDLVPGASATAPLTITQAGIVEGCTVVTANALLIAPPLPGAVTDYSGYWQFVGIDPTPACQEDSIGLLTVGSMIPG